MSCIRKVNVLSTFIEKKRSNSKQKQKCGVKVNINFNEKYTHSQNKYSSMAKYGKTWALAHGIQSSNH